MKKLCCFAIIVCVVLSCTKGRHDKPSSSGPQITGEWEWYSTFDPRRGFTNAPGTDKHLRLIIRPDSTYMMTGNYFVSSVNDSEGTYKLNLADFPTLLGYGTYISLLPNDLISPMIFKYHFTSPNSVVLNMGDLFDAPIFYFVRR